MGIEEVIPMLLFLVLHLMDTHGRHYFSSRFWKAQGHKCRLSALKNDRVADLEVSRIAPVIFALDQRYVLVLTDHSQSDMPSTDLSPSEAPLTLQQVQGGKRLAVPLTTAFLSCSTCRICELL